MTAWTADPPRRATVSGATRRTLAFTDSPAAEAATPPPKRAPEAAATTPATDDDRLARLRERRKFSKPSGAASGAVTKPPLAATVAAVDAAPPALAEDSEGIIEEVFVEEISLGEASAPRAAVRMIERGLSRALNFGDAPSAADASPERAWLPMAAALLLAGALLVAVGAAMASGDGPAAPAEVERLPPLAVAGQWVARSGARVARAAPQAAAAAGTLLLVPSRTVIAHLPTLQRFLLSAAGVKCPACECSCKAPPPPKRATESCTAKSISTLNRVAEAMRGEA